MGESSDGSSAAAQSAQPEGQSSSVKGGGFLRRLFGGPGPGAVQGPQFNTDIVDVAKRPKHGLFNLRQKRVEDVAVPKAEIVAVPDDISKDDLLGVFRESGLTRLPVFKGTLDTPIGMVHLKDFALTHGFNGSGRYTLSEMLRPLVFVPPSMPLGVLLAKMQTERRHMALVIDEYGGVDGLVTIEDLIEQVVGEIEDEHDLEEDTLWTEERPGSFLVQARAPLADFEHAAGLALTDDPEIDREEIDTLGGLVFMLAGRVPARGEVVPHPSGLEFEVVDADPRRIKRLRVRLREAAE
ncbi:hemolysin family protein [Poseidonocella sedimentorum]|uniref:Magnesium and cobalt transporter n=1 Tax=Poseidonocella sedimentorum TaxID=871652 RepID=A0A1I6DQ42_9RHOB|nr:hemolysin family protein [Poseidonocella sedimentorum]SFR07497.1 magnesium and cobalt transporter [Poseidonocella sedimentorum]